MSLEYQGLENCTFLGEMNGWFGKGCGAGEKRAFGAEIQQRNLKGIGLMVGLATFQCPKMREE